VSSNPNAVVQITCNWGRSHLRRLPARRWLALEPTVAISMESRSVHAWLGLLKIQCQDGWQLRNWRTTVLWVQV